MGTGFLFFPHPTPSNSPLVRGRKEKIPLLTKEGLGEVRARGETEKNVLE